MTKKNKEKPDYTDNNLLSNLTGSLLPISQGEFGRINSLLVYGHDIKIIEQYYNGYQKDILHEFQSVTKSLQAILMGIALEQHLIGSIDMPIKQFFNEYDDINWGNAKDQITIKHLMQMTTGLDWNEGDTPYLSLQNHSNQLAWSKDWIRYALNRSMNAKPGEKFSYSSANPILVSAIINKVFIPGHECFVNEFLFKPLSITHYNYHRCPNNLKILADIELFPTDMAKIGRLVLKQGIWKDVKVLPSKWVNEMLRTIVHTDNRQVDYAYFWWVTKIYVAGQALKVHYAWGYGGQHIFIIKSIGLVMVCTGKNYEVNLHNGPFRILEMIASVIIKATFE